MTEDTQVSKMLATNNIQSLTSTNTGQHQSINYRQLEVNNKTKSRENFNSGQQQKVAKRNIKNYKQPLSKRDHSTSKGSRGSNSWRDVNKFESFGGRKIKNNAQNLLNFQYAPIRNISHTGGGFRRKRNVTFNKEAFLQANCHFVVDETKRSDYLVNTMDPDILVDWQHIHLVYLQTHDQPECPICLYPPKVAKMTRCGHVYCWSCILHYLKLSEKSWRKCPICHEAVHEKDLKSVILKEQKKFTRLDNITMQLMRRAKDTLIPIAIHQWSTETAELPIWNNESFNASSKLMLASKDIIAQQFITKEITQLEVQLNESLCENTGEDCFIKLALEKAKEKLEEYGIVSASNNHPGFEETPTDSRQYHYDESLSKMLSDTTLVRRMSQSDHQAFSDDEYIEDDTLVAELHGSKDGKAQRMDEESSSFTNVGEATRADVVKSNTEVVGATGVDVMESNVTVGVSRYRQISESSLDHSNKHSYFFYQSEDGQNIFLHSLNARCLIEQYGSLDMAPQQITGQIIDFECYTMTKELRKRYRYLSHLPVACEFIICELMLRPPVLSKQTIRNFMPEFKKRKAERFRRLEEQKKFDRKASAAANKQGGFQVEYHSEDEIEFDLQDQENFPSSISPPESFLSTALNTNVPIGSIDDDVTSSAAASFHGPSFAQIMKAESTRPMSNNQNATRSAWGTSSPPTSLQRTEVRGRLPPSSPNASDDENELAAPSFRDMFSLALNTQSQSLEAASQTETSVGSSKGKKKKQKGRLLFGTAGHRKY